MQAINDALNGQPTDYDALQEAVAAAPTNRQKDSYLNASDPEKYDQAAAGRAGGQAYSQTDVNKLLDEQKKAPDNQKTGPQSGCR
ncbi:hypothetical protein [Limosilactobacillus allomucosae]|uniref:hypothetical protein n=1 Tax=Limosilactobacillus allomucosae TaxID=3142938 RepID=UPI0032630672